MAQVVFTSCILVTFVAGHSGVGVGFGMLQGHVIAVRGL